MCVEARVLWMEQDRLVSPSTLATNYAITGTFITAWSANEQNGVREKKSMAKKGLLPRKPWQIFVPCSVNANHPRRVRGMERMYSVLGLSEQIRPLIYILMDLNWNLLDARLKINRRGGYSGYLLFILACWLAWPCSCLISFFFLEIAFSNACRGYNYRVSRCRKVQRILGKKDFNFSSGKKIMSKIKIKILVKVMI